jgi:hypothetical protein
MTRHPVYAWRDKVDLAWEGISYNMKESGMFMYTYGIYIQIQKISAKAMQTITIWPVLSGTSQQLG